MLTQESFNQPQAQNKTTQAEDELGYEISNYLEQHGVSVEMNTDYALDAFTLISNPSQMVIFMDATKAIGKHVNYADYKMKTKDELQRQPESASYSQQKGRHFLLVEHKRNMLNNAEPTETMMTSRKKRFFGKAYSKCVPIVSQDTSILCMPRFYQHDENTPAANLIDFYNFASQDFWKQEKKHKIKEISTHDPSYLYSLELPSKLSEEPLYKDFITIVFGATNRYAAVLFKYNLLIFDLQQGNSINQAQEVLQESTETLRIIKPIEKLNLKGFTYDRINSCFVNDNDYKKSRVVVQSKQYEKIDMFTLQGWINSQENSNKIPLKSLGGAFIYDDNSTMISVKPGGCPNFWEKIRVRFTRDGLKAIVQTPVDTWLILTETSKHAKIPYLKNKSLQMFYRGEDQLLFCAKTPSGFQFSDLDVRETGEFSNTSLEIKSDNTKIVEAYEFDHQGRTFFHVTAILENEEVRCWDFFKKSPTEKESHTSSFNSTSLSSLRWPFFTYADGQSSIVISNLANREFAIHFDFKENFESQEDADSGHIDRLKFSADGNLYILLYTHSQKFYYRLNVKSDFYRNSVQNSEDATINELIEEENDSGSKSSCLELLYKRERGSTETSSFWIIEQKVGVDQLITILEMKESKLIIFTCRREGQSQFKHEYLCYPHEIAQICQINETNFVLKEKSTKRVRLLTIYYDGTNVYSEKVLFTDTQDIKRILADKNHLYCLCHDGGEFTLKCFFLQPNLDLKFTGRIKNLELVNPDFIKDFDRSRRLFEDILICSDQKFVKIYDEDASKNACGASLQSYSNYLPQTTKGCRDRIMPITNMRNCAKSNRMLLMFSYPKSGKPKLAVICPYIGNNTIELTQGKPSKNFIWLAQSKTYDKPHMIREFACKKSTIYPAPLPTHIFQFDSKKFVLQEFDMAGILKKQSFHSDQFFEWKNEELPDKRDLENEDMIILAIGCSKLTYLLTPEEEGYMSVLTIKQITESHLCVMHAKIDTKALFIPLGNNKRSLFDIMYDMKKLGCSFDFKLYDKYNEKNNKPEKMQILLSCYTATGYLMGLFLIIIKMQTEYTQIDAHQVVFEKNLPILDEEQPFNELFQEELVLEIIDPNSHQQNEKEKLRLICQKFLLAKNCLISDNQVVVWSDNHILYANLDNIAEGLPEVPIYLNLSDFQLCEVASIKADDIMEIEEGFESDFSSREEYIDSVFARDVNYNYNEGDQVKRGENVVIKIRQKDQSCFLMYYDLARQTGYEHSSLAVSSDSQIFYNFDKKFMVADPEFGIINLETREVMYEYHMTRPMLRTNLMFDMQRGNKMFKTHNAKYFVVPNNLLTPYSLLSVVQHYRPQSSGTVNMFFTKDFYRLNGETMLHKLIKNPIALDKLIDDYFRQDLNFLTTLLLNKGEDPDAWQQENKTNVLDIQSQWSNDVIDMQVQSSNDELINKILYLLSKVDPQYTYQQMQPKMHKLAQYVRFLDYFSVCLMQTQQMKTTRAVQTSYESGETVIFNNDSPYLDYDFKKEHLSKEDSAGLSSADQGNQQENAPEFTDDDFVKPQLGISQVANIVRPRFAKEDPPQQVHIFFTEVSWMFHQTQENGREKINLEFLKVLVQNPDCLPLFSTPIVQHICNYLWEKCRWFLILQNFLPLMVFNVIPLAIISVIMPSIELKDTTVFQYTVFYVCLFLYIVGTCYNAFLEVKQVWKERFEYITSLYNFFQLTLVTTSIILVVNLWQVAIKSAIEEKEVVEAFANQTRIILVFVIQLLVLELFSRVRIFDFFAYFVRQLEEIVKDALPLGSMLLFITLSQMLLFWILDQNSEDKKYQGFDGLGRCFIDSYRLSIGDFEIAGSFVENTEYIIVFWIIFFMGTLISLLVILNMVVALMGSTFERVNEQTEAQILKQKLGAIIENFSILPPSIQNHLKSERYILVINVDPTVDPIEKESMETRINDKIKTLENMVHRMNENLQRVKEHVYNNDSVQNLERIVGSIHRHLKIE